MPAQALLNELPSIQLFNFHLVENEFINGPISKPTSASTSTKPNKNKAKKNATTKQHFDVANSGKNKVNCDVDIVFNIDKARKNIQSSLASKQASSGGNRNTDSQRIQALEIKVTELQSGVDELRTLVKNLSLQLSSQDQKQKPAPQTEKAEPKQPAKPDDDDDDVDLFGSDDDEEANELRQKRLDAYAAKKAKKPATIAKSSIVLDVKPWDDETDMTELEKCVRSIQMDGLLWGASKLVPVSYGIKKLQIVCVIEDEKVSVEELTEKIEAFEDFVQSVDIAAFNKI